MTFHIDTTPLPELAGKGLGIPAARGCTCPACRGERRRVLDTDTDPVRKQSADAEQSDLGAFGDE